MRCKRFWGHKWVESIPETYHPTRHSLGYKLCVACGLMLSWDTGYDGWTNLGYAENYVELAEIFKERHRIRDLKYGGMRKVTHVSPDWMDVEVSKHRGSCQTVRKDD